MAWSRTNATHLYNEVILTKKTVFWPPAHCNTPPPSGDLFAFVDAHRVKPHPYCTSHKTLLWSLFRNPLFLLPNDRVFSVKRTVLLPLFAAFLIALWLPPPFGCGNATPTICAQSQACEHAGLCAQDEQGRCTARSETDCAPSALCKDRKRCYPYQGECVTLYEGYCEKSPRCQSDGLCTRNFAQDRCEASTHQDCLSSEICKKEGRCSPQKGICQTPSESAPESSPESAPESSPEQKE